MSKKTKSKTEYRVGKVGQMVHFIAETYKLDEKYLRAQLALQFPELKEKKNCANCGASMAEYPCNLTYFTAELIREMARIVRYAIVTGKPFTEANRVHRTQITGGYTIASQFTIASKLGLIAKVMKKDDRGKSVHDSKAGWLITTRGFKFLKGEAVPASVRVFRNQIQERYEEMITIDSLYTGDHKKVEEIRENYNLIITAYHTPTLL